MFTAASPSVPSFGDKAYKAPCRVANPAVLPAHTYAAGVLTASASGALPAIDGVSLGVGNRLLLYLETVGTQNGIYTVTSLGDASHPWVLTRATDANLARLCVLGSIVYVTDGTLWTRTLWAATATWTLDATDPVFRTWALQAANGNESYSTDLPGSPAALLMHSAAGGSGPVLSMDVTGDAAPRLSLSTGSGLRWSDGTGAYDTKISRSAAATIRLDNNAGGSLTLVDLVAAPIRGATPVVHVYTSSTTWSPPAGLLYAIVEVVGGGGGGGGVAATAAATSAASGGGGGGGYARKLLLASALSGSYTVTVGTGGGGGAAGTNNGNPGNASSFAGAGITTITGNGGGGGTGGAASSGPAATSGGGGGAASGGDLNEPGGDGGHGVVAGTERIPTGHGGVSHMGTSRSSGIGATPAAGKSYGGGGGGTAVSFSGSATAGGNGADGVVVVTEYYGP